MRESIQRFFSGRNGTDDLNRFFTIVCLLLLLLGTFLAPILASVGTGLFLYIMFRALSRNLQQRSQENAAFLQLRGRVQGWVRGKKNRLAQRKTHRFFKCPSCKQAVRVPKGKGKISISCPSCHTQFIKKS